MSVLIVPSSGPNTWTDRSRLRVTNLLAEDQMWHYHIQQEYNIVICHHWKEYRSSHFLLWSPRLPLCSPCQRGYEPAGFPRLTVWWSRRPLQGSAGGRSAQFLPELYMLLQPVEHYCCPGRTLHGHTHTHKVDKSILRGRTHRDRNNEVWWQIKWNMFC